MKILSWNCQGLGNPQTVQNLLLLVKDKTPNVVFLMETKLVASKVEGIKRRLGWEGCFVVDPMGRKGGLALLWCKEKEVEILNYSQHHINAMVRSEEKKMSWLLSGFYGHPVVSKRKNTWDLLSLLNSASEMPWCVIGDFNEILCQTEKMGGRPRPETQMVDFRKALDDNRLFDLGWKGNKYTWSNKHMDSTFTKERLDRAVANLKWSETFCDRVVETLNVVQSDHMALMLDLRQQYLVNRKRRRLFRFEAKWIRDEEGAGVVERAWRRADVDPNPIRNIQRKLNGCKGDLIRWGNSKDKEVIALLK
ncbi:hypothetical protein F2P56_030362 [Juglans regia]|uniref:Uncharacterized protein LOC109006550 n=2 Tax=Juglans regia TaxID=51240 RepID=A0A2I4GBY3_JUGRE|nr:uncharacterized protein LOC109006550 [Juglans regia]KAF5449972.1 hypothetical protein F2P56_030362 [Juglans regia]